MGLTPELLDELVAGCRTPKDVESLYSQMLQHMINRSLEAEMQAHLGYGKHEAAAESAGANRRNGHSRKTVQSEVGALAIDTPRDRDGTFEPQLLKKRQLRLAGMEEKILALYARGMTTRDIEAALAKACRACARCSASASSRDRASRRPHRRRLRGELQVGLIRQRPRIAGPFLWAAAGCRIASRGTSEGITHRRTPAVQCASLIAPYSCGSLLKADA